MLENCTDNRERWQAVESMLQGWLKERREVLVRYTAIAANLELATDADMINESLTRLCQLLVDYVSVGHFEVFHELIREAEAFKDGTDQWASELIPSIGDTTEVVLGFDEKYPGEDLDNLAADLSLLGEVLESRFELEDKLIAALHASHAGVSSES